MCVCVYLSVKAIRIASAISVRDRMNARVCSLVDMVVYESVDTHPRLLACTRIHVHVVYTEHLGPMVDSVIEIANKLDDVEKYQHFMRVREQNHRDTSINTNSRVQWMAIIESVVLISLSILQLKYITAWFAETGKSGRV